VTSTRGPDGDKEERDEEVPDLDDSVLDLARQQRPPQEQPGGERADDDRRADAVGQPGQAERERQRQDRGGLHRRDPPPHPQRRRHDERAEHQRCGQEAEGEQGGQNDAPRRQVRARRQAGDDTQDDQAEDIVDDRSAQDNLALRLLEPAQVGEHAGGDSHARRGQGGPRDDRDQRGRAQEHADRVSQPERQDHPDQGDRRRSPPDPQQLTEVRLDPNGEQEDHHPQLGEQVKRLVARVHEGQHRRAEDHPCRQFAEHGRLAGPLHRQAEELGRQQHHGQHTQELRNVQGSQHEVGPPLTQRTVSVGITAASSPRSPGPATRPPPAGRAGWPPPTPPCRRRARR
jgi:hypothetical protein